MQRLVGNNDNGPQEPNTAEGRTLGIPEAAQRRNRTQQLRRCVDVATGEEGSKVERS